MQKGIQDAAHGLCHVKAELEVTWDWLADVEDRHWALLTMYDADKAFQEVVETFHEFEKSEHLSIQLQDLEGLNADDASEMDSNTLAEKDGNDNKSG